jgi:hypothetical protein
MTNNITLIFIYTTHLFDPDETVWVAILLVKGNRTANSGEADCVETFSDDVIYLGIVVTELV